jgi:hypothetical protein
MTKRSRSGITGMLLMNRVSFERTLGIQRRGVSGIRNSGYRL